MVDKGAEREPFSLCVVDIDRVPLLVGIAGTEEELAKLREEGEEAKAMWLVEVSGPAESGSAVIQLMVVAIVLRMTVTLAFGVPTSLGVDSTLCEAVSETLLSGVFSVEEMLGEDVLAVVPSEDSDSEIDSLTVSQAVLVRVETSRVPLLKPLPEDTDDVSVTGHSPDSVPDG